MSPDQAVRRWLVFGIVRVAGAVRRLATSSETTYKLLFLPGFEAVRWRFGKWHAWVAAERARKQVPAYRTLLDEHGDPRVRARGLDPDIGILPVTDKQNYVGRFSIEERCRGGAIPPAGVVVDESSGTSGTPWNWVRGPDELKQVKQAMQVALHHQFGREPLFVLNAFALGPWATGMNVSMSVVDIAILKSVGPDIGKLQSTLALFGPRYRYLIAGYPPFLKSFVDTADIDWAQYDVTAVFGGEGMSEGMRSYLLRSFRGCTARTAPPTSRSTSPRRATSRSRCGASSWSAPSCAGGCAGSRAPICRWSSSTTRSTTTSRRTTSASSS